MIVSYSDNIPNFFIDYYYIEIPDNIIAINIELR